MPDGSLETLLGTVVLAGVAIQATKLVTKQNPKIKQRQTQLQFGKPFSKSKGSLVW